jgi:PelA/Pel-15E family pectate lyase
MKNFFFKVAASALTVTFFSPFYMNAQSQRMENQVLQTMKSATRFMIETASYNGGFVWSYLPDLSRSWGELEAKRTMVWIQPPGTPTVGHLLLDAYHSTGDEYYYESAKKVANALIWGQLPCGGWNYVFDFAGENSLKQWYATVGKNAWRLEEFQHYYGNATFDDSGTMQAAKFLLRMYVEKNDPVFRYPLEKVIRLVLESQYPVGGWPQRYPLMYDHPFQGKKDYTSFITMNDDVISENTEFLIQCYQAMGLQNVKEPIMRAMNLLIILQQGAPYAGWADQYTVEDLQPAHARSYEPRSINAGTTVRAIHLLMEYYHLTGESKFLAGIPAAIAYLESTALSEVEILKFGRPLYARKGIFVPRFVDPDTGVPLYVHRVGSNVVNGHYYTDQDICNTIGHYSSGAFVDVDELRKAYNTIKETPVSEVIKGSPLLSAEKISLPKYYTRTRQMEGDEKTDVAKLIKTLTKEGYWLTPLKDISNPYKECPFISPSKETKYASTFVGDEYDTSCYPSETSVMGISTAIYIANMMLCIHFLDAKH